MNSKLKKPADYIKPLYINKLRGRMLVIPTVRKPKKQILLLYDSKSSLEEIFAVAEELSRYGVVTAPDIPGFGGMDSMYKIGLRPTANNLAAYLASFIKLRYRKKQFVAVGLGLGLAMLTKTLQNYPDLQKNVGAIISISGFSHPDDFKIPKRKLQVLRYFYRAGSFFLTASLLSHLRPGNLLSYRKPQDRIKTSNGTKRIQKVYDLRTHLFTSSWKYNIDLCQKRLTVPAYHIALSEDQLFDASIVEQHLAVAYDSCRLYRSRLKAKDLEGVLTKQQTKSLFNTEFRKKMETF